MSDTLTKVGAVSEPPSRATRVAFCGHVDHGKSTLLGRILLDTGAMSPDRLEVSPVDGGLAFLLDGLVEERDGLFTLDTTQLSVNYDEHRFTFIDLPGHAKLVKNMMTGATQADAVTVVVDVTEQLPAATIHQMELLALIGIDTCVLAVTKMDTVNNSETAYLTVVRQMQAQAVRHGFTVTSAVPVAAIDDRNITRTSLPGPDWYNGPSLMEALAELVPHDDSIQPTRFFVQGTVGHRVLGKVLSGTIRPGDTLINGEGEIVRISAVERYGEPPLEAAIAGQSVALVHDYDLSANGTVWSSSTDPQVSARRWRATLVGFTEEGVRDRANYELRPLGGRPVRCRVDLDGTDLAFNTVGTAILTADLPLGFDTAVAMPTSRFVLHSHHASGAVAPASCAVGVVRESLPNDGTEVAS